LHQQGNADVQGHGHDKARRQMQIGDRHQQDIPPNESIFPLIFCQRLTLFGDTLMLTVGAKDTTIAG
jgi:hypothetical protein